MGADGEIFYQGQLGADKRARAYRAANGLYKASPLASARHVTSPVQRAVFGKILAALGVAGLTFPALTLIVLGYLTLCFFVLVMLWRLTLALLGNNKRPFLTQLKSGDMPVYTILIALHDEVATVPQLANAIRRLDYPQDRLDLKFLLEDHDTATRDALQRELWPRHTQILRLPPGDPQTKPRALNYGLESATGEYIVVYDAEDRPHPQQLRAALAAFEAGDKQLACVQAPLKGVSRSGWLSGHWALEYALQFGLILPALARLKLPILLGGTSNHFRRTALETSGGWDAWNVTEDADLGLRLARNGYLIGMIAPPTLERPPRKSLVWINQRSRWLKGFMQTWLVLMREPKTSAQQMGLAGWLSTQLLLGGAIVSSLVHGPWLIWCLLCAALPQLELGAFGWTVLAITYALNAVMLLAAPGKRGLRRIFLVLTAPLYWPLQSLAAARALYGLANTPHFWAKTPHEASYKPPCQTGYFPQSYSPLLADWLRSPIGRPTSPIMISSPD